MSTYKGYFAAAEGTLAVSELQAKLEEWTNNLESNGFLEKLRMLYAAYHGAYYSNVSAGHQISFSGEQGELVNLPINHLRNIGQHILNMTCTNRPSMEARASNTDYKSLVQTTLANNILDYYMRDKRLEDFLKTATELAIVFGAGFIKMDWNATSGEVYEYLENDETGEPDPKKPVYEGDIQFSNLSPFDVIVDGSKESWDMDWVLTRTYKNKYDISAKYPEFKDKVEGLQTKSDLQKFRLGVTNLVDKTDDIPIYEFYHKITDSMPNGRYLLFLSRDIILQDTPIPYRVLPVFRISAGEIIGTPYGYSPLFDILPLQEGVNSLYSTILTNQNAFGVQNILNPRGNDIAVNSLAGGLNIIDYNPNAGKPEPLNLTQTPAEVFKFIQILEQQMETISGVNSVSRGNPEASLKSGAALALVQSMALQFMSGLQQSYVKLIEDVGTAIIKILQDYAKTPRLIAIAGQSNRSLMKEFNNDDITHISRVVVSVGNPLARTTAGRVQMAEQLIQYGEITPKQYVTIIDTGNLDEFTESVEHENLLMKAENEAIVNGETPSVTVVDEHVAHIKYHKGVLADPDLRKDPELVKRVTAHIQMHIDQLRQADPQLLQVLNQQPLPNPNNPPPQPPGPPPAMQGPPMNMPPPGPQGSHPPQPHAPPHAHHGSNHTSPGKHGNAVPEGLLPPPQGYVGLQQQGASIMGPALNHPERLPNVPHPPKPFQNLPVTMNQLLPKS